MYFTMASQMKVVESQINAAHMNATMLEGLKGVTKVMTSVNASMNPQ